LQYEIEKLFKIENAVYQIFMKYHAQNNLLLKKIITIYSLSCNSLLRI